MQQNPSIYTDDVYRIVLDEKEQGVCMDNTSCTKGLLWLKRYVLDEYSIACTAAGFTWGITISIAGPCSLYFCCWSV